MSAPLPPACELARSLLLGAAAALATTTAILALLRLRTPAESAQRLERATLHCARICFLLLALALAAGAVGGWMAGGDPWPRDARGAWALAAWLTWYTVLHVNRVKDYKGRTAAAATVAAWILGLMAALGLRPWA